jgi:hypothetical protein
VTGVRKRRASPGEQFEHDDYKTALLLRAMLEHRGSRYHPD